MTDLKPCPFCGGDATYLHITEHEFNGVMHPVDLHDCGCDNAGCMVRPSARNVTHESARAAWNTRATPAGTIITEDESSRPVSNKIVVCRHPDYTGGFGVIRMSYGCSLHIGCIWWPIPEGMFRPPEQDNG